MHISSIAPEFIWAIWWLPLAAFAVIAPLIRPFPGKAEPASYISIGAIGISFILSCWLLISVWNTDGHQILVNGLNWLDITNGPIFNFGLLLDPLSAVMLVVVTAVSFIVQVYSRAYMHSDPSYRRYFAFISLFTASMLGLIMSTNLLSTFIFWELVGLSSYLLIGFWFHRPSAIAAAKKAFLITRIGDIGFLAALLLLYSKANTLDILALNSSAVTAVLSGGVLTLSALGLFLGAVGKSGQFPLHIWLPDAMEGPTPVSALIHAATMVAAGVFLVGRMYPLFDAAPHALTVVGIVGAFTAVFAGTMGLVMKDIKRVLAYSTISQLGLMFLGLALGGVWVGIFYLFNHAFFKALLFLGAGSINHATGTFDMREMGGLRKKLPCTCACFTLAALSLAGIWPLAGFFSKEEVLTAAWDKQPLLFIFAIITTFLTAFYIFRVVFMVFAGKYRGSQRLHESSKTMLLPMIILAIPALASGWLNANGGFERLFVSEGLATNSFWDGIVGMFTHPLPWISLATAGFGILLAYVMYIKVWVKPDRLKGNLHPIYAILTRKYWMDDLYEKLIAGSLLYRGVFRAAQWFDQVIINGATSGLASITKTVASRTSRTQNGALQLYALVAITGILIIALVVILI
ncbi:MAG: NADH-quinone oxidoreductase subunit L [Dehalococcoidia bacterium]|nr:NADH-quinone oxidoreductase subunit L [Dehalococcoidia bacterium]